MKKFLLGIFAILIIVLGALSYLGLLPFMTPLAPQAVDLGMTPDPEFVSSFETKYGQVNSQGAIDLEVDLSDQDITSILYTWGERDKYFPLHDVQIRFNQDGTGEASGYLKIVTAVNLAKNLGYTDHDIEEGKKYINYVSGDLPIYVKGKGGMKNNILSINPSTFQVGRVTVPDNITSLVVPAVSDMITRRLEQIGGANIREASFENGAFHLDGTVPATIKY